MIVRLAQARLNQYTVAVTAAKWDIPDRGSNMRPSLCSHHLLCVLLGMCTIAKGVTPHVPERTLPKRTLIRSKIPARVVKLQAECTCTNNSTTDISRFVHRVTMPPTDLDYQILIEINGDGIQDAQVKRHKNGIDNFLSFSFPIPAQSSVTHHVAYTVLLVPLDYLKTSPRLPSTLAIADADKVYLDPSPLIESDSQPVRDVARVIAKRKRDKFEQIRLAYEYPAKHLKFRPQPAAGAVSALRTGIGDCTEYSAVFVALCRALGTPARQSGVFHFRKDRETYEQPNHNSAEVYLGKAGWVPVDPNIGGGKYNRDYGLGRAGSSMIVLLREGAWVWGNWLPQDGYDNTLEKPKVSAKMKWGTAVIKQGTAVALYREFVQQEAGKRPSSARLLPPVPSCATAGTDLPDWKRKRVALEKCYVEAEFRVFYTFQGESALSPSQRTDADRNGVPDKIQNIARQLVVARQLYVEVFKFRHPFEAPRYKDRVKFFDVHVARMPIDPGGGKCGSAGDGIVNYQRPADPEGGHEVLTIDISKDLSCENLTPAHELFHGFQNGYSLFKNAWYTEGTARWVEYALRKGSGKAGRLPHSEADREALYGLKYKASGFWNALAEASDSQGTFRVPAKLSNARYLGTKRAIIEDLRLHGVGFIRAVLEELDALDDEVSKKEALDPLDWKESRQRASSNNDVIWEATMNACQRFRTKSSRMRKFIGQFSPQKGTPDKRDRH